MVEGEFGPVVGKEPRSAVRCGVWARVERDAPTLISAER